MNDKIDSGTSEDRFPTVTKNFAQNLRVRMSPESIGERAVRSAELDGEIEQLKKELEAETNKAKAHLAGLKADIEKIEAERQKLSLEIRDGSESRLVKCERRFVYRTAEVQEWRMDTNPPQQIRSRPMTEEERNPELPFGEASPKSEPKPAAEDFAAPESEDGDSVYDDGDATCDEDGFTADETPSERLAIRPPLPSNHPDVDESPDTSILDERTGLDNADTTPPPPPELATEKKPKGKGGKGSKKSGGGK